MELVENNLELRKTLGSAGGCICGSHENWLKVTFCPVKLTRVEIECIILSFGDLVQMMTNFVSAKLKNGFIVLDGEKIFFISNPARVCGPGKTACQHLNTQRVIDTDSTAGVRHFPGAQTL